ncbi:hypothetical protein NAEGRDRAFT_80348 [Naegleria gruberi]|uniref:SPRY domain-containing protein n=1 Tax=Naegleria gruberi TaxID=5762 RepID=D2VKS8_NAEGR|nr:uncharacterized protein NAEGRDRAFT_80348 [Naegleria gruberi]EFC42647.1 hypothetical protein NAEGRDRAFT_80348 [Naegleria gruberi]|eukprot:XP_002675391.1 hypothetical protein NAEGRDRAFT_80348 [Naegleria gruberi strain NEG-M]
MRLLRKQAKPVQIKCSSEPIGDVVDIFSQVPHELMAIICRYLKPWEFVSYLSGLNSYYYGLTLSCHEELDEDEHFGRLMWKYYYELYCFVNCSSLEEKDYKTRFMQEYLRWSNPKACFGTTKHINISTMKFQTLSVQNTSNRASLALPSEFGMTSGKFYFRIAFDCCKLASGVGIIRASEAKKKEDQTCCTYMRDGSCILHDGEKITDRVKEVKGKKMRVYNVVEPGDVVGVFLDIEQQLVTFSVNGKEVLHIVDVTQSYPGEAFHLFIFLPPEQSYTLLPCLKSPDEIRNEKLILEHVNSSSREPRVTMGI